MNRTRLMAATILTAGLGAGLFGTGTAGAAPGQPCDGPRNGCQQPGPQAQNGPQGQPGGGPQGHAPAPVDWQQRGIDQGRRDHQPFNWNGHQVTPMPAGNGHGWGFWFLGTWIPL